MWSATKLIKHPAIASNNSQIQSGADPSLLLLLLLQQDLPIDARSAEKLKTTADELVEERALALECIGDAAK